MTPLALLLGFLAGACSLSFELLWARSLSIEVGGPLASFTLVVCSFMLGLAIGAAWLGRCADSTAAPLRLFGLMQTTAGFLMLLAAAGIASGGMVRLTILSFGLQPGTVPFLLVKASLGGGLAFLPALAMGGTLPLLFRAATAGSAGGRIGVLAAVNAAGAAVGSIVCGFFLLPRFGVTSSVLLTAGGCLVVGLTAVVLGHRPGARRESTREPAARGAMEKEDSTTGLGFILSSLFISGLAVTALEIVWTRLAYLSFGSSVQAGSLVLAAVIAGLSLGNAAGARLSLRTGASLTPVGLLACAGAFATLATDPLLGRLPLIALRLGRWLVPTEGSSWELATAHLAQFALMFALCLLPCLFLGAMFPLACAALLPHRQRDTKARSGRLIGLASAATSAGNLLGAPAAYFGLIGGAGSRGCLLAAAATMTLAGLIPRRAGADRRVAVTAAATLILIIATGLLFPWDLDLLSSGPFLYGALYDASSGPATPPNLRQSLRGRGDLIFSREGADALVTVRRLPGGLLSMQVNGKTDASTGGDMKTQMLTAHLPLLLRAPAEMLPRVLVIGLGSGVTAAAALAHPVARVEVVEISPEVVSAAGLFEKANRGALRDPRTRLVLADARARLMFATANPGEENFDVIASQPSNPWIAGQALLFTREYFMAASRRLSPGGVMCQWVQGYGLEPEDFRSVVATFAGVFPHVSMWEESTSGGDYLLLGSPAPLPIDPARIARRLADLTVAEDLRRVEVGGVADLLSHFVSAEQDVHRFTHGAVVQTEDRLSLEFTAPLALHRDTLGSLLEAVEPYRSNPAALAGDDGLLSLTLIRQARTATREREWAAGLGLFVPAHAEPDLVRAASYLRAGMRAHAMDVLRALTLRRPSDRVARLMLGYLYMSSPEAGSMDRAIRELQVAADLDPDNARGWLYLSRAQYAAGRLDAALTGNMKAARLDPGLAETSSDRCAMMLAAGDGASAEAACREAIARDEGLAEAHANLGVVQSRRGRVKDAERSYRRALALDPGLTDARFNLAALCERQGRGQEGLAVLAPLVLPGVQDAAALRLAARLALQANDPQAARDYLGKSLELVPASGESEEIRRMLR